MNVRRKSVLPTLAAALALAAGTVAAVPAAEAAPASAAGSAGGGDVYVAPSGDDHAKGDARHPVRTLGRARALVRERNSDLGRDLTVHLASGTYRESEPLALDARDSGSNGHRVVWQGSDGTVISGGKQVTGWHEVPGHKGLWSAPAPRGLGDTRQLYVDGARAVRAAGEVPVALTRTDSGYTASSDALASWPDIKGAEFVYTSGEALWNFQRDGLGQWTQPRCDIAAASGTSVTMVQPCWDNSNKRVEFPDIPGRTISMVGPGALTNSAHVTYMENARELLDTPGEWYLDRAADTVYYMPRKGEDLRRADVEAPALEKLVDGRGTATAPLHDIAFRGVQFSYATWLEPSSPEGFSEIQAGYTISGPTGWADEGLCGFTEGGKCPFGAWTKEPGNVAVTYGQNVEFSDDAFVHLGAAGLELGDGTQNATVRGSVFTDISGNGMEIGGVDKPLAEGADVTHHVTVTDNHLYALPREYAGGVGILNGYTQHNLISHNQIDHVGYSAISMGWGGWPDKVEAPPTPNNSHDNTVSDNLITDYMQGLDDGGGIYTQGLTGTSMADGEKVTGNVIHGQFGLGKSVYTDNGATYETVSGNVLYDASYANVASRHTDYRDDLGNNDPTLVSGNWWEQGDADSDNKGLVTRGNHIIAAPSDAPEDVVAGAGLEPAYRSLLGKRFGARTAAPEAPTRVATATGPSGTLLVTFNPSFVDGGAPVESYQATAFDPAGHAASTAQVSPADFHASALVRLTGLTDGVRYRVVVTARNSAGTSAASLPAAPLAPRASTALPDAPSGVKLRAQATAATVAWTPPKATGDSPVIGYRITLTGPSGSRVVDVSGRDALVGQITAKGMFRVIGGLQPGTAYSVAVAAVTGAGTGPSASGSGTTPDA